MIPPPHARAIVVTGVSRGLGEAIFCELIEAGHKPIGIGRRFTESQSQHAQNGRCFVVKADFAHPESMADLDFSSITNRPGRNIVLISNAGTIQPIALAPAINPASFMSAVAINFSAPALLSLHLGRLAQASGSLLRILNISSGASTRPIAGWAAYCSGKAAARMFFSCLALDNSHIEVQHVDPGVIDTGMQEEIRATFATTFPAASQFAALKADGKLPSPAAVAHRILLEAGLA